MAGYNYRVIKSCQNCATDFEITSSDLEFLQKISPVINGHRYEIPPPTLCPDCRQQRRLAFRNERSLYKRNCDLCGKSVISMYSTDKPFKQFCNECYYSDKWDGISYSRDFDFHRPFFEQFAEHQKIVPRQITCNMNFENAEYANFSADIKNCYLVFAAENSENCYYCKLCQNNLDCADSDCIWDSELCYDCLNVQKCYNCISSCKIYNCSNCFFSYQLRGCRDCLFCHNLNNKQNYIFNKPYSKDDFQRKIAEFNFQNLHDYARAKATFLDIVKNRAIHRASNLTNCENCTGDDLADCKNMKKCYDMQNSQDCAYCTEGDAVSCYDCNNVYYKSEKCYELMSTLQNYNVQFSAFNYYTSNVLYSELCWHSSDLFGCIGIFHRKYCVFNKQYSPPEYEKLITRIIEHMQQTGEWGQFFPLKLSAFDYHETLAQEWYPPVQKNNQIVDDNARPNSAAPTCKTCHKNFKIIEPELNFYRKMNLPIPENCYFCRYKLRFQLKNPRKLWLLACQKCGVEIQTTFAPARPEKVYCEECYLRKAY